MTTTGRRRGPIRMRPALERQTHIAIADLLRRVARPGWWWSHIPSGELRSPLTGALLQRMGLRPGMADYLFISPEGLHCWLELKRGSAALSDSQNDFHGMCRARGIPSAVARSFNEAVKILTEWGTI